MAYNKSKHVEAAQKLLNQGKVPQAVAEYQQILKYEPRDQVTLMTIGELYIRQGETFQAIDYFERLAQIFIGDGFLTKAIAVYKRIAKLAPEEIRPLEKLADLYVQQGVMSEARPLFLQLAELHLKNNRQPEAVGLLKKLLLAEPDNLRIQIRLADLYQAMGQTGEAVESYVSAAQRSLARGDQAEAEKLADKGLKLDPANLAAITVKARAYSSQGNTTQAAELLAKTPNLEKGGEQTELLLDLYAKNGKWDEAEALARRVFDSDAKNFGPAQKVAEALLESGQTEKAAELISHVRMPLIDSGEHEVIGRLLNDLASRTPGRLEPLEWLVDMYGRTSDSFRLPDALAHLADGLVGAGKLERAREVCQQLVDRQPESESAKRKLNEILRKLGQDTGAEPLAIPEEPLQAEIPKPEAPKVRPSAEAPLVELTPAPALPAAEPVLDDETQKFIAQSLTDVDLFASYGLTQKAIGLLEAILRRAPRHTPTLEKLLDFVLGAGDDRRTAELAAELERIHTERDDARGAERFGELRRRYQRAAGLTDADLAPKEAAAAPAPAAPDGEEVLQPPVPPTAEPSTEEVHEVDLSSEWESAVEQAHAEKPAAPAPSGSSATGAAQQPAAAQSGGVTEFEVPPVVHAEPEAAHPEIALPSFEEVAAPEPAHKTEPGPEIHEQPIALEPAEPRQAAKKAPPPPAAPKEEPEFELEQEYELVLEQEPLVPAHEQRPPQAPAQPPAAPVAQNAASGGAFASDQFLADLASEIDQLGMDKLSPSFSEPAAESAAERGKGGKPRQEEKPAAEAAHEPLREVFDEFRAELGEMGAEDEDLETHYNLGIAFREMGLLEEAISEFQKVAKANDHGKAFRYAMQCCTLLGLAFMEKGQPGIAAIWYERALTTPGVDQESMLALRYDLGVAQESAGDPVAALKSFSQVYAVNIDYRDVAERIAALQKPIR